MRYRKTIILEDNEILKSRGTNQVARIIGCDPAYISRVKNNRQIASENLYKKLKELLK